MCSRRKRKGLGSTLVQNNYFHHSVPSPRPLLCKEGSGEVEPKENASTPPTSPYKGEVGVVGSYLVKRHRIVKRISYLVKWREARANQEDSSCEIRFTNDDSRGALCGGGRGVREAQSSPSRSRAAAYSCLQRGGIMRARRAASCWIARKAGRFTIKEVFCAIQQLNEHRWGKGEWMRVPDTPLTTPGERVRTLHLGASHEG